MLSTMTATGLIDCEDTSCLEPGFQSCTASCTRAPPCIEILDDPAIIRVFPPDGSRSATRKDFLKLHGRVIPTTPVDPFMETFTYLLSTPTVRSTGRASSRET